VTPQRENQLTLARILGVSEDEAAVKLEKRIAVTSSSHEAAALAADVRQYIERSVALSKSGDPADLEILIGADPRIRSDVKLFVSLSSAGISVGSAGPSHIDDCHPLLSAIAACYVAGFALCRVLGLETTHCPDDVLTVRFADLGVSPGILETNVDLSDTVLVGAGAIGNAFLFSLRHVTVSGELTVADPKDVGGGNANRCVYFDESSHGPKAVELCRRAQLDFPKLTLTPYLGTFSDVVKERGRVKRAIVAADSRRVRRSIQADLPFEVIDASTSGAEEIVVYSRLQPTYGACLACVYKHVPVEDARERDIAAGLGISIDEVKRQFIDEAIADKIAVSHPNLCARDLVGRAFDSLFKELCSTQALLLPSGEQVLAPFAFVSGLAGALLVVQLLRATNSAALGEPLGSETFFVNPWRRPNARMRKLRPRDPDCAFCSDAVRLEVMREIWQDLLSPSR
jgi:hypothetical protein